VRLLSKTLISVSSGSVHPVFKKRLVETHSVALYKGAVTLTVNIRVSPSLSIMEAYVELWNVSTQLEILRH
jgi:hypothetical protein